MKKATKTIIGNGVAAAVGFGAGWLADKALDYGAKQLNLSVPENTKKLTNGSIIAGGSVIASDKMPKTNSYKYGVAGAMVYGGVKIINGLQVGKVLNGLGEAIGVVEPYQSYTPLELQRPLSIAGYDDDVIESVAGYDDDDIIESVAGYDDDDIIESVAGYDDDYDEFEEL